MKIEKYDGQNFQGEVVVTYKIDGIQLIVKGGEYTSRAGKPLYNLPEGLPDGVYEIYRKNFKSTIEVVRSPVTPQEKIKMEEVYRLDVIDPRLVVGAVLSPTRYDIEFRMCGAVTLGYEGLVLRHNGKLYKVKTEFTEDVPIVDIVPGKGKHTGRMGALITPLGKVGTGFTDADRVMFNDPSMKGRIIEVSFMEKTEYGKFRHPRFVRLREDKG